MFNISFLCKLPEDYLRKIETCWSFVAQKLRKQFNVNARMYKDRQRRKTENDSTSAIGYVEFFYHGQEIRYLAWCACYFCSGTFRVHNPNYTITKEQCDT